MKHVFGPWEEAKGLRENPHMQIPRRKNQAALLAVMRESQPLRHCAAQAWVIVIISSDIFLGN